MLLKKEKEKITKTKKPNYFDFIFTNNIKNTMICYYCKKEKGELRWRFNPICKSCYNKKINLMNKTGRKFFLKDKKQ